MKDIFNKLIVNGVTGDAFANIRPVASNSPVEDVTSNDIRCNVGGTVGSGTATAKVAAGSTVSVKKFTLTLRGAHFLKHHRLVSFWITLSITKAHSQSTWVRIMIYDYLLELGP